MTDVLGQALSDYFHKQPVSKLWIHNTYGKKEAMPVATYFRSVVKMPDLELIALQNCTGKVLDIGAGAGSHALELQEKGIDVTALEMSPKAIEVIKLRGVEKWIEGDVFTFSTERFDTLLLLMNGIGLTGNISGLRQFLQHAKKLIEPSGQLIFDSSDVAYLYDGNIPEMNHYYGEIAYRYEYKKQRTDWFTWLYIDQKTLIETAFAEGWKTEVLFEDENDQYLVKLILKQRNDRMKLPLIFILPLCFLISCSGGNNEPDNNGGATKTTPIISYAVKNIFPHDTSLYTEGFLMHDGQLFESTGSPDYLIYTKSMIGITNLKTGKFDKKAEIDKSKYFGEGIVFFKDKLYELTYKNQIGFIYDTKSFNQVGKFNYSNTEGWSLTTNGKELIMSDGTENLTFLHPQDLKPIKTLRVTENGLSLNNLNELEYIKGYIYANVWTTNYIVKIDPLSGKVVSKLDLSALKAEAENRHPGAEVLNGIAYDSTADKIFVTGKLWANIYQIDFAH